MKTFSMDLTKEGAQTILDTLEVGAYNSYEYAAVKFMKVELAAFIVRISKEEN
ncbi:hypothetical protein [Bacillus wiedmannii]|uniref:hypothetical protein n=1 Tax=Bacillus wiedmannii TaxID=1890302 RepID=UPI0015CF6951|nr:hypothetical protein [Bacillus wiedmannii]